MKVLSKRHSLEIVSALLNGPLNITQISEELGIPYTTAQQRVEELELANLVEAEAGVDESSKRAVRFVRSVNFRIELSPRSIHTLIRGGEDKVLKVT